MKVLNVQITMDPVRGGGTAERTFQMSRALSRYGVGTTVLTTTSGLRTGVAAKRAQELYPARLVTLPILERRFHSFVYSPRALQRLVREHDIVHLMGHWNLLNVVIGAYARRLGKPYVCSPAGELVLGSRSLVLKQVFNKMVGLRVLRGAAGYIAVTDGELPQFSLYGLPRDLVSVIPNGVAPGDYAPANEATFRAEHGLVGRPYLLFIGGLAEFKGPDLLLEAFLKRPPGSEPYTLVFVGPDRGNLVETLRARVRAADADDRVRFIGYLGGAEKWAAYAYADLLIIPSRHEAMSIVALEAGLAATPVLLTDQCGFAAVAAVNGGRVVPATVQDLYDGLASLLSQRASLPRLGENLRRYVVEEYDWNVVVKRFVDLYSRILVGQRQNSLARVGGRSA